MQSRTIRFSVRGQGGHIHVVRAQVGPRTMSMSCSCGGEGRTLLCTHAERLLDGDTGIILSRNVEELDDLIDAAWTHQFGRWLSIRREYGERARCARAHLAEATERRAFVGSGRSLMLLPPPWQVDPPLSARRGSRPSPR